MGMYSGSITSETNLAISNKIEKRTAILCKIYTLENFTQICKVEHKTVFAAELFITEQPGNNSNVC